ncbi:MAG: hypothetical protein HY671_05490 [Chloroflexi bacterium]|nr:hypothetical protein [Chloroflexota bacterium]
MAIFKFLWLAIRPVGKLEAALGWWDVLNLLILAGYIILPNIPQKIENLPYIPLVWFAGIPALLFLIAGLKLQYRLTKIESAYHYALSFDRFDLEWRGLRGETILCALAFSNALDKPLQYELDARKTYIEIAGKRSAPLDGGQLWIIPAHKPDSRILPQIDSPVDYPCKGRYHHELVYGLPDKPLFRQIRESEITFQEDGKWFSKSVIEKDERISSDFSIF